MITYVKKAICLTITSLSMAFILAGCNCSGTQNASETTGTGQTTVTESTEETTSKSSKSDSTTATTDKKTDSKTETTTAKSSDRKEDASSETTAKSSDSNAGNSSGSNSSGSSGTGWNSSSGSSSGTAGSSGSGSSSGSSSGSQSSGSSSGSNSSSGSTGSGSSTTQPATTAHTHNWVAQYKSVYHEAIGHYENVWVETSAAWDETQDVYEYHTVCFECGLDFTAAGYTQGDVDAHGNAHLDAGESDAYGVKQVYVRTDTIHHDAKGYYEQRWVTDSDGWTEKVLTGYICSCGATK